MPCRRIAPFVAVVGLALGLAGGIASGHAGAAGPVDWRLGEAGREPLTLDLEAFGSSCLAGTLTAQAVETPLRIEITVVSSSAAEQCTADYRLHPVTVRLAAPVRGRRLVGPRHLRRDALLPRGPGGATAVPRVTGLAPADAVAVVRRRGLHPRVERVADVRGLPRVAGQTPASGRRLRARADVTLFVTR